MQVNCNKGGIILYNSEIIKNTVKNISELLSINEWVRQGCNSSPTLFSTWTEDIVRQWNIELKPGILLTTKKFIHTWLVGD